MAAQAEGDDDPRDRLRAARASSLCANHTDMCVPMARNERLLDQWRDRRTKKPQQTAAQPSCPVKIYWGDCADCNKVFGHVLPQLMASAAECPVACEKAPNRAEADLVLAMFDYNPPPRTCGLPPQQQRSAAVAEQEDRWPVPQAVARLHLEGRSTLPMTLPAVTTAQRAGSAHTSTDSGSAVGAEEQQGVRTDLLVSFAEHSDVRINYVYSLLDAIGCSWTDTPAGESAVGACVTRWLNETAHRYQQQQQQRQSSPLPPPPSPSSSSLSPSPLSPSLSPSSQHVVVITPVVLVPPWL